MKRAHARVTLASGGDIAFGEMLVRLPLSPQDHDVVSLCSEVAGWTDDLMARPKAKAKGKAIASPASAGGNRIALALRVNAPPSQAVAPPPPSPHVASLRASPSNAMAVAAAAPVAFNANAVPAPVAFNAMRPVVGPMMMRPPPPSHQRPTVDQLLDEARSKAPAPPPSNNAAPVDPVPLQAPEVSNDDRPICAICQDHLSSDPSENVCLPCGHVFHSECTGRLRQVADQQGRYLPPNYCSFRCHESNQVAAAANNGGVPADHGGVAPAADHVAPAPANNGQGGGALCVFCAQAIDESDESQVFQFPCGHKCHRICGNGPGRDLCPYRCHQFPVQNQQVANEANEAAVEAAVERDRQEIEELFN